MILTTFLLFHVKRLKITNLFRYFIAGAGGPKKWINTRPPINQSFNHPSYLRSDSGFKSKFDLFQFQREDFLNIPIH